MGRTIEYANQVGESVPMSFVRTLICVLALAPTLSSGGEMHDMDDNGFQFTDPILQRKFADALKRDGVVFQQRKDGMVIYSPKDEGKVKRVQMEILDASFTPSQHFEDEELQIQFMNKLDSHGIRFAIKVRDGKKWVTWSEQDNAAVQKISDEILDKAVSERIKSRNERK